MKGFAPAILVIIVAATFSTVKADEANDIYYQCTLPCWNDYTQGPAGKPSCRERCPVNEGLYDAACLANCKVQEDACNNRCVMQYRTDKEGLQNQQETTDGGQNNAGDDAFTGKITPLWGGLARPFDELLLKSKKIPTEPAKDLLGNDIEPNEIAENWKKAAPVVKIELPLENLEKVQLLSTQLPDGLPLRKAIFVTYEPIKYAKGEITIFDGKTTPKLLRKEEKGGPIEYDEQEVPEELDQKKYDINFYFRIGTAVEKEEVHPFKEAMFELFPQLPDPEAYENVRVLRWYQDQQKWNDLPVQSDGCGQSGKTCRVIAKSAGTSYFAVVLEKKAIPPTAMFFGVLFWLGILSLPALIFVRKRFSKKRVILLMITAFIVSAISFFVWVAQTSTQNMKHAITLKTTLGDIQFETYDREVPKTVKNFISLARGGFYDKVIFHRVVKDFMIQGGDPTGTGTGGPGYKFEDELNPETVSYKEGYKRGVVAMANTGPNTNGSQFFIMLADNSLPHSYTIFGKVINGQEVVDAIGNLQTDKSERPLNPPQIQSVIIERLNSY